MPARIALIAHDRKKYEIVNFVKQHQAIFYRYQLIATGTTGQRILNETSLNVELMLSGAMGGDVQIAAQVAEGKVAAVIFLVDPLYAQPHEPDIQAVQRICAVYNVPLATDVTIAAPEGELQAITAMVNLLGAALLKLPTNREDIIHLQTKRVKVTTNPPQKVVVDGEIIGTTPVEIECIPGGLTVLAPAASDIEDEEAVSSR
ncbi:MAG: methylglyoxal synthase [Symploca sp. SIO2E9]|nr:methylglyoxal synthase [Symploca sp. SIO2E9]